MPIIASLKYRFMKDVAAPVAMSLRGKRRKARKPNPHLGPPLRCSARLKQIMMRHYFLAGSAKGARPIAWVTSGAPVEMLRALDFYTLYPENHGALCGATRMAPEMCGHAEEKGFSRDLCSYARTDLGHAFSGMTPAGKLPKPDLLFCSNNICQTVQYWYKQLAHLWRIPLILFDTPFVSGDKISDADVRYMSGQLRDMIPDLERVARKSFNMDRFEEVLRLSKDASLTWGRILDTMKARPAPMTIFDAFVHMAPIVSLRGLPVTLRYYHMLLEELRERVDLGIGGIAREERRLMWDNIAIWFKLKDFSTLFAEQGYNFVCATYTNAWAETTPLINFDEPLFDALAKTYGLVILNRGLRHRLSLMERMIHDYQVDGLVIHSDRSCKPYSVGQYDLQRILEERCGIKTVVIEADMADSRSYSEEQVKTRLQAFFEV